MVTLHEPCVGEKVDVVNLQFKKNIFKIFGLIRSLWFCHINLTRAEERERKEKQIRINETEREKKSGLSKIKFSYNFKPFPPKSSANTNPCPCNILKRKKINFLRFMIQVEYVHQSMNNDNVTKQIVTKNGLNLLLW